MGQVAPGSVVLVESVADAEARRLPDPTGSPTRPRLRCRWPTPRASSRCCGAASRRSRGRATRTSATPPPTASAPWPRSRRAPSCSWSWVPPTRPIRYDWSRSPASRAAWRAELISTAADIDWSWLDGVTHAGPVGGRLGSGAAGRAGGGGLPRALRAVTVEEVRVAEETVTFRSPPIPLGAPGPPEPVAVYTDGPPDAAACVPRRVRAGCSRSSSTGIAEGVENSNFRLQTERGRYILTIYEKRVDPADLPFFLGLIEHLACHGLPCPLPVQARDGRALRQLTGKPAAIVSCLKGSWPRRIAVAHCAALGSALAALHLATADFRSTRANALSLAGWQALFEGCRGKADAVEPGLEAEIAAELADLAQLWPQRPAGGRDPRRPVPGQRVLRARSGERHHRLLLRLQRPAGLRRRDLPERLVLRARRLVQCDQGQGAAAWLSPAAGAVAGRDRGPARAGARRGPAFPDDAALRLAASGRGR